MARILILGTNVPACESYALALFAAGYDVEVRSNPLTARTRFDGPAVDVVVVDVASPDGGCGLLLREARAAWPGSQIVALTRDADLRHTAVDQMGLWDPDLTLVHPVTPQRLVARLQDFPPVPGNSEPSAGARASA